MREDLPQQVVARHAGDQQFGYPDVLVADQPGQVFPLRMRRVARRLGRVESDMAGSAGGADQERRFDRGIGQFAHLVVGAGGVVGQLAAI
jgi:hypothetical protein